MRRKRLRYHACINLVIVFAQEGGASDGCMSVFHIKPTGETGILVCVPVDGVRGVLEL
jgi:hypothetical protein